MDGGYLWEEISTVLQHNKTPGKPAANPAISLPDGVGEVITGQCELDVTTRLGNNYCCHKTVCRAHLQY